MLEESLAIIERCFAAAIAWMSQIFDAIPGAASLLLAVFAIHTSIRLLLAPIVGAAIRIGTSDLVKSHRRGFSGSSGKSSKGD